LWEKFPGSLGNAWVNQVGTYLQRNNSPIGSLQYQLEDLTTPRLFPSEQWPRTPRRPHPSGGLMSLWPERPFSFLEAINTVWCFLRVLPPAAPFTASILLLTLTPTPRWTILTLTEPIPFTLFNQQRQCLEHQRFFRLGLPLPYRPGSHCDSTMTRTPTNSPTERPLCLRPLHRLPPLPILPRSPAAVFPPSETRMWEPGGRCLDRDLGHHTHYRE